MNTREKYMQLVKMLDSNPVGAPNSKEFLQMLEILYPGEQLDMALLLTFKNATLEEVAEKAGMPAEQAKEILETMAKRGTICSKPFGETRKYRLWPIYAGFFEYSTMSLHLSEEEHKRLNELWRYYYKKTLVHEVGETNPPWKRVLPAENSFMEPDQVLPYEIATELLKTAKSIALTNCACRTIEQKCDKPVETCLAFNESAEFMIEYGHGRRITVEEAVDVLKLCEEAGLVHMTCNCKNSLLFMCNCCGDCCHLLRPYTEYNYPDTVSKSSVRPEISAELCIGCGTCANRRCPVKALSIVDGKATLNERVCIGCGLCVSTCPKHAIRLVPTGTITELPDTIGELSNLIYKTKREQRADPNYVR